MKRAALLWLWSVFTLTAAVHARAQYPYDVPFVPTPPVVVEEMLRLANVGADDFVMDLGSGDGRMVIAAATKFGARAVGVDLDQDLIDESWYNAQQAGVLDRVTFRREDFFKTDFSQATVVTLYLLPGVNSRLRPRFLKDLKPGTRIVAHDFGIDDWQPDERSTVRKNVFLWIVPADISGRWNATIALPAGQRNYEFEIRQKFQEIDGVVRNDRRASGLWKAKLRGDSVSFVIVDDSGPVETNLYFEGRAGGDTMEGIIRRGVGKDELRIPWRATRIGAGL